ncbi:MAG: BamA/TamA family outer membrane protein [Candidatus Babeliales bacterium]
MFLKLLGICIAFLALPIFCFDVQNSGSQNYTSNLVINLDNDESFAVIDNWWPKSTVISKVTCKSDIHIESDEFYYLLNFKNSHIITANELKKACHFFKYKNQFKTVTFVLRFERDELFLDIELEGVWTFHKVHFHGPMLGKDSFRQYYLLEATEPFDIKKHEHSIQKINEALWQEGYFEGVVIDSFSYNQKNKSVIVDIIIDPNTRFIINDFQVQFTDSVLQKSQNEFDQLKHEVIRQLESKLLGHNYSKELFEVEIDRLKQYLKEKGYLAVCLNIEKNIKHESKKIFFLININLGPQKTFIFYGNQSFNKKELLDQILIFGNSTNLLPISILTEEIEEFYRKNGFWQVEIEFKQENNIISFFVKEGKRISIDEVTLYGIDHFNAFDLSKQFFKSCTKSKYYNSGTLKRAISDLLSFYIKEGFWDVQIIKQEYIKISDRHYCLNITLDEGNRRILSSIEIPEHTELLKKDLFLNISKKLPLPINFAQIQEQRNFLIHHFQNEGYLYIDVKPEIREVEKNITLIWHIDLKQSITRFGKTIVTGCNRFPFRNIMRQLPYKEGEIWNKEKLDYAIVKLRELGIFETIHVSTINISQPESEKNILIKVIEDDPIEVRMRGGFQQVSRYLTFRNGSTYKAGGSLLYRNPFNVGDFLRFDSDVTRFYRYVSGSYMTPWTMGYPVHTIVKGYANKYIQPVVIGSEKPLYTVRQEGALVGLSHRFKRSYFGFNLGFEFMETSGLSVDLARAINFEPQLIDQKVPYFFIEPSLFMDYLDDKLNPAYGSLTAISFKGMFSWKKGSVNFFKLFCEQSVFVPLLPIVVGIRIRLGHIFNQTLSAIMPPERFFLGGANSLRGYEPDLAPPLGIITESDGKQRLVPQGGKSMMNGNIEFRFPIYKGFGGTVFQDVGILIEKSMAEITGNKFLASSGFGLRYNTPVGPLRFDLGFKWKKRKPEDSSFAWFLTFGNAF